MARSEEDFLSGGGELGALMREYDWGGTPLGPPSAWPRSLKTIVRVMLTSRQPVWLGWGPELTFLYNDPYKSIVGGKHPWALGRPFNEVWREILDVAGPLADTVMRHDEGIYVEAQLLIMERHGYQEETYYTFSYSPVPDDNGEPGGLFCANTDDTRRVIGERQLSTLRELAAVTANSRTYEDACRLSMDALAASTRDIPFALIYLQPEGEKLRLIAGSPGTEKLHDADLWPGCQVMATNETLLVHLGGLPGDIPRGAWPRPPEMAAAIPIPLSGQGGVLVVGLNPFRQFDDSYRAFLDLAARQIAAGIAHAQAYEQERQRAEALAELDRAKTAFFSNVSHEFRTPLTLMLGPLQDLLSQPDALPAEARTQAEVAHRNALRLLKLVNALLDFSRIEAGRLRASYQPVDLCAFTTDLASVFRSAVEREGLRLTIDCEPFDEPAYVDREMWEKIVFNLLSNAFKFTFEGGIEFALHQAGRRAVLTVKDTGIGIPAAELPHVFERFHRVEGARGRTMEGSGIGLALVQELVNLHGGEVGVRSTVGQGTTFTVIIPLGKAHLPKEHVITEADPQTPATPVQTYVDPALNSAERSAQPAEAPAGGQRPRILLAEDNADMREYVRSLLLTDYDVETVADGSAALDAARRERPALVVTDVMMPRMDGFELLQALRADENLSTLPVIMLSARAGEEARVEGVRAGADDYLVKPFSARELLARVAARLELGRLRAEFEHHRSEADRRKDEFLAALSHELRNPLAPLKNSLYLLRRKAERAPAGEDSNLETYRMMDRQLNHLIRLVDDLLEVSRITRGVLELRREKVDLGAIARNAVEASTPLIEAGGHQLEVDVPDWPLPVDGDSVRLTQILGNLLNNAARYTPPGGQIHLQAWEEAGSVVITVRDNGIGIAPDLLPKLFQMFSRGDHGPERAPEGLGIGLALARHLAELHGGTLTAHSEGPGEGSEFTLRLPGRARDG